MGTSEAVNVAISLTQLAMNMMVASQRVQQIVSQAQSEGRDLTEEEKQSVIDLRKTAMDRWDALE